MTGVSQSHHGVKSHQGQVHRGMGQADLTWWESAGTYEAGGAVCLSLQGTVTASQLRLQMKTSTFKLQ